MKALNEIKACTKDLDLNFFLTFLVYKSSFRDSISRYGKNVTSDHKNRVFETRFIGQNRVSETRDASIYYSLEIETTNYIVEKLCLVSNFRLT